MEYKLGEKRAFLDHKSLREAVGFVILRYLVNQLQQFLVENKVL